MKMVTQSLLQTDPARRRKIEKVLVGVQPQCEESICQGVKKKNCVIAETLGSKSIIPNGKLSD